MTATIIGMLIGFPLAFWLIWRRERETPPTRIIQGPFGPNMRG